ncbi:FAD-dependent oxidoreductase [Mycolicibacterium moriokaense]|jgi:NADH dehydrogenase|uniref:Dehydrogenase n=1 Tax=Mycolicibacterium moriokaense TaxID=39691 RepID=A0AAD1H8R0_9MYCO|nr:FAD-dependent oxidoreductase [Mycolicibacterium moriokaense]MCV7041184.1 FAD-dependent oxidoreductase [Mycolicibacterium moriokaense]ORB27209.1 FAD-dependent oxidoreductase [Mycolicibacterium moriokaense]BBX00747.1 dehydrogenase [Mycolicibacterium moriokaense]
MTENHAPKVVVIGGGYSGTLAANQLRMGSSAGTPAITLVNPRPKFVERIRLHQHVAGNYDATVDYGSLLGDGIKLVVDTATRIDAANRTVELASGKALDYDYVVYAVGSTGTVPASVPGATEFAYPLAELEQAQLLRDTVDTLHPDAPVTVVGAGLTGIEAATELAEQGRRVTLVCGGQLGPYLSEPGRRSVAKVLRRLGVAVLETDVVTEVRRDAVVFADGAVRPSAVTVWAAGFGVPDLAANSGLRTDKLGRLLTDETLTSIDDERIVAAGDCASPSGEPLRMCCASASQLGPQAANTVLSRIAGTTPANLEYGFGGACISLGRKSGIVQLARQDDSPVDVYFSGRLIAKVKEGICKGTLWALRRSARKPGATFWLKGGPRPEQPVYPKVAT